MELDSCLKILRRLLHFSGNLCNPGPVDIADMSTFMADPINKKSKVFSLATSQTWHIPSDTKTMEDSAILNTHFSTSTVMVHGHSVQKNQSASYFVSPA